MYHARDRRDVRMRFARRSASVRPRAVRAAACSALAARRSTSAAIHQHPEVGHRYLRHGVGTEKGVVTNVWLLGFVCDAVRNEITVFALMDEEPSRVASLRRGKVALFQIVPTVRRAGVHPVERDDGVLTHACTPLAPSPIDAHTSHN